MRRSRHAWAWLAPLVLVSAAIIRPGASHADAKHVVGEGESLWNIAREYGVPPSRVRKVNRLSEAQAARLKPGDVLWIPGVERRARPEGKRAKKKRSLSRRAKRLGLGTRRVAGQLLQGHVEPRWERAARNGGARFNGTLRWPVTKGWFVRGFGSGAGGYHQAMDIGSEVGMNVRAAAPGIVAYSDDVVPGYGKMVMLVHPGGWVTLYAHNSVNFVRPGQNVKRGGVLAEVGSTGKSRGPHVHFELLHDGKQCDPASLFRPGVKRRKGGLRRVERARWRKPDKRPRRVRCAARKRHPGHEKGVEDAPREPHAGAGNGAAGKGAGAVLHPAG